MSVDIEEALAGAELPETTVELCLRRDLVAQFRDLERQLATASREVPSLGERAPARVVAEQLEALREEMTRRSVRFRLRAMPALDWSVFHTRMPQRGNDDDAEKYARDKWYPWVAELVSRCCVDPKMSVEQIGRLVDRLSAAQWDELCDAAWGLNANREGVPFSEAASAVIAIDDAQWRRPSQPESPPAASTGVSPEPSPPTNTTTPAG